MSLLNKLRNKHFLSLSGNGMMAVLSVVTYAVLFRILSEEDMGNWIFIQMIFALLDAIRTGFLQTAFIKFFSGAEPARKAEVSASTWYLAFLITISVSLLNIPAWFLGGALSDEGVLFFLQWFGLSFLLTLPFNVVLWILQAEHRFDRILILRTINQGSFIICLIAGIFTQSLSLNTIALFYIGCSLLTSMLPFVFGWYGLNVFKNRTKECAVEITKFGRFSVGTYMCSTVFKYSDSIIIKFMIGPAALAVYNLAQRLLEVIEIPVRSFLATAMPAMSEAYNKGDKFKVTTIMKKYTGTLTLFLVPIIVVMLLSADVIVAMIGGGKYLNTEAANVFRIFMVFAILFPIDRFSGITLDIIHKPQINLVKISCALVINIVTDIIALKLYPNVYGVAAASFVTLAFGVTFGYIMLNRYLPFNIKGVLSSGYIESKSMITNVIRKKPVI